MFFKFIDKYIYNCYNVIINQRYILIYVTFRALFNTKNYDKITKNFTLFL